MPGLRRAGNGQTKQLEAGKWRRPKNHCSVPRLLMAIWRYHCTISPIHTLETTSSTNWFPTMQSMFTWRSACGTGSLSAEAEYHGGAPPSCITSLKGNEACLGSGQNAAFWTCTPRAGAHEGPCNSAWRWMPLETLGGEGWRLPPYRKFDIGI